MKKAGIIILIVGLLLTIFSVVNFVTKEKVLEVGEIEVTRDKQHGLDLSPFVGIAVIVAGGLVYFLGKKK
jgi:sorbitol-specific phosphotransferase system component IIC